MTKNAAKSKPTQWKVPPEQARAIAAFAIRYGRSWKRELRMFWSTGYSGIWSGLRGDMAAYLQQVRNNLDPEWLESFTFTPE